MLLILRVLSDVGQLYSQHVFNSQMVAMDCWNRDRRNQQEEKLSASIRALSSKVAKSSYLVQISTAWRFYQELKANFSWNIPWKFIRSSKAVQMWSMRFQHTSRISFIHQHCLGGWALIKTSDKLLDAQEGNGESFFVVTHISAGYHGLRERINDESGLWDQRSIIY